MGSSNKKKKEKKKDFQKPKLKVGKTKPKPNNFTDTSFKAKSIVVNQQTLVSESSDTAEQFKQNLSVAVNGKSDNQRRDALAYLTNQLLASPPNNPVGTPTILIRLLPLLSDTATPVRTQLLKLFRALPWAEVKPHTEKISLYVRRGMTHLSNDIRIDTLSALEWLLEVAGEELVSCPGGWLKTLSSFSSMLGWSGSAGSVVTNKGWTSAPKATLATSKKELELQARVIQVLTKFLQTGFRREPQVPFNPQDYWDNLYRIPRVPNPFDYMNLWGPPRDMDSEMYQDRESRQRVFNTQWRASITKGVEGAKKHGGAVGRAAVALEKALADSQ